MLNLGSAFLMEFWIS